VAHVARASIPPHSKLSLPYPACPLNRKAQIQPEWAFFRSLLGTRPERGKGLPEAVELG